MSSLILAATGYPSMLAAAATDADLANTIKACRSTFLDLDQRIAACTQLLAMPDIGPKPAALAHFYRGLAQLSVGRSYRDPAANLEARAQSAMPEIDTAIALDPDLIAAYRFRASLHHYVKQFDASAADYDKVIAAYPKISGLYALRGTNLSDAGQIDTALAEYETALSLAGPDDLPKLYWNRAYIEERAGHLDQALADLNKAAPAIQTQHQSFLHAEMRGRLDFMSGKYDAAIADLIKAQDLSEERDQYYLLWLYLAEARKGQDAISNLRERLPFVDTTAWPGPLLRYFANDLPFDQVKLPDGASDRAQRAARCELEFYLGEVAQIKGDRSAAIKHFRQVIDTNIIDYIEYSSARMELQRMAQ